MKVTRTARVETRWGMREYDAEIVKQLLTCLIVKVGSAEFSFQELNKIRSELNISAEQFWVDENNSNPWTIENRNKCRLVRLTFLKESNYGLG